MAAPTPSVDSTLIQHSADFHLLTSPLPCPSAPACQFLPGGPGFFFTPSSSATGIRRAPSAAPHDPMVGRPDRLGTTRTPPRTRKNPTSLRLRLSGHVSLRGATPGQNFRLFASKSSGQRARRVPAWPGSLERCQGSGGRRGRIVRALNFREESVAFPDTAR